MAETERRAFEDDAKLPTWARILLRVLFREGPITIAMLVMLAVVLGIIPSPYLGKPLELLVESHKEQLVVLEQIRDDLKKWHEDERRTRR